MYSYIPVSENPKMKHVCAETGGMPHKFTHVFKYMMAKRWYICPET
jgi:hypothetical protein